MSVSIPSKATKKYTVSMEGDLFGNIIKTRNLDFNKKGYISLARKPYVFYTETQDSDFQTPLAIANDGSTYYIVTSKHFFILDIQTHAPGASEPTGGSPPTLGFQSDYAFFTADIHVSGTTMVCSLNAGSWTSRITGLSSSYPHPLCVSEHQSYLAVGNGNSVKLYDASYSLVTTCTIPASQIVTWIRWKGNLLYFGTRNINGGEGRMYIWNGAGTAANSAYGVGSSWAMSGCEYGDTIAVASQSGLILIFAGNGFVSLKTDDGREAAFPVYFSGLSWANGAATFNLLSSVASRGMVAKGRRIFIFADARIGFNQGGTPNYLDNFPSGLYVFDPTIGLYHKAGIDHAQVNKVTPSALAANVLTLPSSQIFETGDPVATSTVSGLTGDIVSSMIYYAIKVDSTHLKLATTSQQAVDGQNITITGTPGVSDQLVFNTYKSVGATLLERSGPVHLVDELGLPRFCGSEVVYASEVNNNTGTTIGAVMSLGMGKNVGSFETARIQAENVTDIYKTMVSKFPSMNRPSQKVIIKYRSTMRSGAPGRRDFRGGNAVWVNSTSFTVDPTLYDVYALLEGDEVEFIEGAAAGYTAHVTLITRTSGTSWTITIDETMPDVTAADVSDFRWDNWKKYKTISTVDDAKAAAKGFVSGHPGDNEKWFQFKVELRGFGDIYDSVDFEEVMLVTGADQKYA